MMYKGWVKCPDCDYFGISTILEDIRTNDKYWVCPNCEKTFKNEGIVD